jgi:hypothetical protein
MAEFFFKNCKNWRKKYVRISQIKEEKEGFFCQLYKLRVCLFFPRSWQQSLNLRGHDACALKAEDLQQKHMSTTNNIRAPFVEAFYQKICNKFLHSQKKGKKKRIFFHNFQSPKTTCFIRATCSIFSNFNNSVF